MEMCIALQERCVTPSPKSKKRKKFNKSRMLAGWLTALCLACLPMPCQSTLNFDDNLLQFQQHNPGTITGRSGCEMVTTIISKSNGLPNVLNSTVPPTQPWPFARVSAGGWTAAMFLDAPETLQLQHKLQLAVELGIDQWDVFAISLGVLLQQLGFCPLMDFVPSSILSPFGFSVSKESGSQCLGFPWFTPWFAFVIDLLDDEVSKLLNKGFDWENWKWKWSPLSICCCLGFAGELFHTLLWFLFQPQHHFNLGKRKHNKRNKRLKRKLRNTCRDVKQKRIRCFQLLLQSHVAFGCRKCSTHRIKKARLGKRLLAVHLRKRWPQVHIKPQVRISPGKLYSGFPSPEQWPLGIDALSWYQSPKEHTPLLASEWLQGGYQRQRKRRKNKSQKTEDNDAVRTLIQGLKTCLNKGTFPTELQPMMNFLNQFMGQPSQKEPAKKRNRTSNSVKSNESSRQVQVEPVPTELETGWWKQNGQWKAYLRNPHTGWWWWKDTTKTETQEQHTSYAQAPTKNHSLQQPRTKPNLAKVRAVNPSEWTTHVRLVEPQTVCEAIKAGQQWQGNICCIHSLKLAQELRDLYNSFAITQGLTLVLSGEAGNQLGVTLSRARLQRTNAGPALEEVSLLGLGKDFPWRNHALTVDPQKVITKIERELVRIVVPNHYRELFVPEPGAERIPDILSDMATWGCKAHVLTGGRWERQDYQKQGSALVGWLKLSAADAKVLLDNSGRKGIFTNKNLDVSTVKPQFIWLQKDKTETKHSYFQRCQKLATERKQALCLRKGGGSDLGFPKKESDSEELKPKGIQISGVPKPWMSEEVSEFLTSQGWTQITLWNRKYQNRKVLWNAKAIPPVAYPYDRGIWVYQAPGEFDIIINDSVHRPVKPSNIIAVKGPKKSWDETKISSSVSVNEKSRGRQQTNDDEHKRGRSRSPKEKKEPGDPTKTAVPMDDVEATQMDPQTQREDAGSVSEKTKESKPISSLSNLTEALEAGWTLAEQGGCGDCGYRALIDNFHFQTTGEELSQTECIRQANLFRTQIVQHIRLHHARYEEHVRGGAQAFPSFCEEATKQTHWICGLLLQAASEVKSCCIVVWNKTGEDLMERFTFAPQWSDNGMPRVGKDAPILVIQREAKHYKSVRPPKYENNLVKVPKQWARETAKPDPLALGGAGRNALGGAGPKARDSPKSLHTLSPGSSHAPTLHTLPASSSRGSLGGGGRGKHAPALHSRSQPASALPVTPLPSPRARSAEVSSMPAGSKRKRSLSASSASASVCPSQPLQATSRKARSSLVCDTSRTSSARKQPTHGKSKHDQNIENLDAFKPDTAAYPRTKNKAKDADQVDTRPQQEQTWQCPLCSHMVRIPAGTNARKRLVTHKCNHLQKKHTSAERMQIRQKARIGNVAEVFEASPHIPAEARSWTCRLCNAGLPQMEKKYDRVRSITNHFRTQHPDVDPKSANSRNRKKDQPIRTLEEGLKMCHDRLVKRASKQGHCLVEAWVSQGPTVPTQQKQLLSLCSRCLHAGSSYVFRKPCVATSVAPKRTVTLVRECIAADSENAEVVRQVLSLNPEEWNRTKIPHLTGSSQKQGLLSGYRGLKYGNLEPLQPARQDDHDDKAGVRIGEAQNPGPRPPVCQVSVRCCNVRSGTGAWAFMEHEPDTDELLVLCLQETRFNETESEAFHRAAQRRGFKVFQIAGNTFQDRWDQPRAAGGIAILVDKRLQCSSPVSKKGTSSQVLGVWIEDWFIATFYAPPGRPNVQENAQDEASALIVELMHETQAAKARWIFCGDANEVADDSTIGTSLAAFAGTTLSIQRGTRWDSTREIDWFSTNAPDATDGPSTMDLHVSDHVPLELRISIKDKDLNFQWFQPGPKWDRPKAIDRETWTQHVESCWANMTADIQEFHNGFLTQEVISVDQEWNGFLLLLDKLMRNTFAALLENPASNTALRQDASRKLAQTKVKGRMPDLVSRQLKRCRPQMAQGDMQLAKLRKRTARLYELKRCLLKQSQEDLSTAARQKWNSVAANLIQKLELGSDGGTLGHILTLIAASKDALHDLELQVRERRLQAWKSSISSDIKYASKWLKSRFQPQNLHITVNGQQTSNDQAGIRELHQFWTNFWISMDRDSPEVASISQQLLLDTPLKQSRAWEAPSPQVLMAQAAKGRGSSGIDGWTGDDLSVLPIGVWEVFRQLSIRWLEVEAVPQVLLQAKAVFIPKPDKAEAGGIATNDCRPITVLSSWWRIWMSAWLQSPDMKSWIPTVLDESVTYGTQSDAQISAACVLDAYSRQGWLCSLDFTKCFDLLRPAACANMLTQSGFCPKMSRLCESFWTSHTRWCQWQQCTYRQPLRSGHMAVPQGDPWGPLMAGLYLSAGQRFLRRQLPTVTMVASNYMDDRSFSTLNLPDLRSCINTWKQWSNLVGLKESNKAQCTAKSKKDKLALQEALPDMFATDVVFLGCATRGNRRQNVEKEDSRIKGAAKAMTLLGVLRLQPEIFASYSRCIALGKANYGWLARLPTWTLSNKIWAALKAGQRVTKMANKWIRAMVHGGLCHLDVLTANNLFRISYRLWKRGQATWNRLAGSPVATLRKWLRDKGWSEQSPWEWTHQFPRLNIQFTDERFDLASAQHCIRDGWRLWVWDQFLHGSRHELHDLQHTKANDLLDLDWNKIRKVCASHAGCRTVALGASVSPAWRKEACPWCKNHLGHWKHLAWECPENPLINQRPPVPTKSISWRFGWDPNEEILTYLGKIQLKLWEHVHAGDSAAAAAGESTGGA